MKKQTKKPALDALIAEAVRASVLNESGRDKDEAKSEGDAVLDAVWIRPWPGSARSARLSGSCLLGIVSGKSLHTL